MRFELKASSAPDTTLDFFMLNFTLVPQLHADLQAKENLELRMKYAEEPMKFIDNEVDLMSLVRGLAQVRCEGTCARQPL
jgi:hypothetical protein